jgi:hypothetical protein
MLLNTHRKIRDCKIAINFPWTHGGDTDDDHHH